MRVIYIAGTSHSGSTLLDLMLNAHPRMRSAGEVLKLNRQLEARTERKATYVPCACGAPSLWQCQFWSAVDQRARAASGKSLAELDMQDYTALDADRAPNAVVFRAMAAASGRDFIVDSSKLPKRLAALLRVKELDVYPVHLVRDPRGQINSVVRKHGGFLKHIFRYELIHAQLRAMLRGVPHSVVHYEDLVRDPETALRAVLKPLGLDFDAQQLDWAGAEKHGVAGNHMRFGQKSDLVLDESWRRSLSPARQFAITLGTSLARVSMPATGPISA